MAALGIFLTAGAATAQDAPAPAPAEGTAPAAAPAPEKPAVVTINRKSRFEPKPVERNPFWPIGWSKQEAYVASSQPAVKPIEEFSRDQFKVSSILLAANPRLAVINGRDYAEGDMIQTTISGQSVEVRVKEITDGYIFFEFRDKIYRYPLRLNK